MMTSLFGSRAPGVPKIRALLAQKRGIKCIHRWNHYRLPKHVGHGRWWRYRERYVPPSSLETTKGLHFNTRPTPTQKDEARAWRWQLPQALAKASTANHVLDAWVYYRRMRKRPRDYLFCLLRLVQLGGCHRHDWRYRLLADKLPVFQHTFVRLPRVVLYLAKLGDRTRVERWIPRLIRTYSLYTPKELGMVLEALARVRLQDRSLFSLMDRWLCTQLQSRAIDADLLVKVLKTHGDVLIHDRETIGLVANEIMRRAQLAAHIPKFNNAVRNQNKILLKRASLAATSIIEPFNAPRAPSVLIDGVDSTTGAVQERPLVIPCLQYFPTIKHLVRAATALASLRHQHFPYFEFLAAQLHHLMDVGKPLPTPLLAEGIAAFGDLQVWDVTLFERAFIQLQELPTFFKPDDAAQLLHAVSKILPPQRLKPFVKELLDTDIEGLSLKGALFLLQVLTDLSILIPVRERTRLSNQITEWADPANGYHVDRRLPFGILLKLCAQKRVIQSPDLLVALGKRLSSQAKEMSPADMIEALIGIKDAVAVTETNVDQWAKLLRGELYDTLVNRLLPELTEHEARELIKKCFAKVRNVPSTIAGKVHGRLRRLLDQKCPPKEIVVTVQQPKKKLTAREEYFRQQAKKASKLKKALKRRKMEH